MTEELLLISPRERKRIEVIERVIAKELRPLDAARLLECTPRQIRNLRRAYLREGAKGLISHHRGHRSNHHLNETTLSAARNLIVTDYRDFGPTLAHEKLTELYGLKLSVESVRQLMINSGVWSNKRHKASAVHQMRVRRPCFGELIQVDGSFHAWFESRGPECCLHVFIDDATSKLTALHFAEQECTQGYFDALRMHLERYGRPLSIYSDKHSIFRVNIAEARSGTGETQLSRALRELGIKLLCANSPQAKGRVERANGTLQDRLTKELRLRNISDMQSANAFLPEYIEQYNARFAKPPAQPEDAHLTSLPKPEVLDLILSHQEKRKISKNLEVSYKNVLYQIQVKSPSYGMRGAWVTVSDSQGKITLLYNSRVLPYKIFDKHNQITPVVSSKQLEHTRKKSNYKPPSEHPWRRYKLVAEKKNPA